MPSTNRKRKELFKLGSSVDQRKIEFVKKAKLLTSFSTNELTSFLFIYYFKNFGAIKLVS